MLLTIKLSDHTVHPSNSLFDKEEGGTGTPPPRRLRFVTYARTTGHTPRRPRRIVVVRAVMPPRTLVFTFMGVLLWLV